VVVPNSQRIDFVSTVNGNAYRMMISTPETPPPPGGYPVVYVIDAAFHYLPMTQLVRVLSLNKQLSADAPSPPAVVAIGYQKDDMWSAGHMRTKDLTLPLDASDLQAPIFKDNEVNGPDDVGGLDQFLLMMRTEVREKAAALIPIDRSSQFIFGHSFGGLAVVRQLLTDPGAYAGYIASSPSIWLKKRAVLADLPGLQEKLNKLEQPPVVALSVGANEGKSGPYFSMVSNLVSLGENLSSLKGIHANTVVFVDEDHNSVPMSAINRGVRAMLKKPQAK
jgi:predicted alpha/beta superfamily hydrolase